MDEPCHVVPLASAAPKIPRAISTGFATPVLSSWTNCYLRLPNSVTDECTYLVSVVDEKDSSTLRLVVMLFGEAFQQFHEFHGQVRQTTDQRMWQEGQLNFQIRMLLSL